MTLKELLAIDEGGDCPGCPVCQPRTKRKTAGAYGRSVSFPVRSNLAAFSVRYTDARTDPNEKGVVIARTP
ncbi:MAG: hypothetical protein M3R38_21860 [Actinomycetota bacterium]|nr:hypothetical protein [Actinomycetota bacterium]